jgi:hypothetical protein
MRLMTTAPDNHYTNLNNAKFACDCGRTCDAMVADND